MTPEQRQYAIGGGAIIAVIVVIALMWFAFGAYR
jgi:hypothetical protein